MLCKLLFVNLIGIFELTKSEESYFFYNQKDICYTHTPRVNLTVHEANGHLQRPNKKLS